MKDDEILLQHKVMDVTRYALQRSYSMPGDNAALQ